MSDPRDPYRRRPTKPLPRVELAPIAPAPDGDRDAVTKVQCPMCPVPVTADGRVDLLHAHELVHAQPPAAVVDDLPGPRDDETEGDDHG